MADYVAVLDRWYDRYAKVLGLMAAFLLPLKLTAAYIFLIPLIALALIRHRQCLSNFLAPNHSLTVPLIFYILCISASSVFGLDPLHSFKSISSLVYYACAIAVYRQLSQSHGPERYLAGLLIGQTVAAIHSVIDAGVSGMLPGIFLGKVTESGQIALTLIAALGLTFFLGEKNLRNCAKSVGLPQSHSHEILISGLPISHIILALCNFFLITLWAFSPDFHFGEFNSKLISVLALLFILGTISYTSRLIRDRAAPEHFLQFFSLTLILPLISSALLVNLKRGPWFGVTVGAIVFLLCYARRYVVPLLIGVILVVLTVEPVRSRLAQSSSHFFISGGRNVIWQIGVELSTLYPLGIGFNNSAYLQKFSLEIPPELRHFHNNFLNIAVESGWLGLLLFFWWLSSIARAVLRVPPRNVRSILAVAIGCAILSWQMAGIVEYNFGDSEVLIVVFILVGILDQISCATYAEQREPETAPCIPLAKQAANSQ